MADALCLEYDRALWFPKRGESTEPARQVCRRCSVRQECLSFALADDSLGGVWAGTSEQQRRALRTPARPSLSA